MRVCPACGYRGYQRQCPTDETPTLPEGLCSSGIPASTTAHVSDSYRILVQIGEGGMGTVWFGEHMRLHQPVAIKLVTTTGEDASTQLKRFRREAMVLSQMQHPNIVRIHDYGVHDEFGAYLVMDYIEGVTLKGRLKTERTLSVEGTVHIARQIAAALSAAHGRGVIHRDLKPANIILSDREGTSDFVTVLDFGIAKPIDHEEFGPKKTALTRKGLIIGTPEYLSPEQAVNQTSSQSDLYALGVLMYECLEGKRPFKGQSAVETILAHMKQAPPPLTRPDLPKELEDLIISLMQKQPLKRPRGADVVIERLDDILIDNLSNIPQDDHDLGTTAEIIKLDDPNPYRRSTAQQVPTLDMPTVEPSSPPADGAERPTVRMADNEPPTRVIPTAPDRVASKPKSNRPIIAGSCIAVALIIGLVAVQPSSKSGANLAVNTPPDATHSSDDTSPVDAGATRQEVETNAEPQAIPTVAAASLQESVAEKLKVTFKTKPSMARVRLKNLSSDGEKIRRFQTPKTLSLPPATYRITISRTDYQTLRQTIHVDKNDVFRFSLRPDMTNLE